VASGGGAGRRTLPSASNDRIGPLCDPRSRNPTTRPAALRHGFRNDVTPPAPKRFLVKFVDLGEHMVAPQRFLENRIKRRNFSNNLRIRRPRRPSPDRAPLAANRLRCRTGDKLEWPRLNCGTGFAARIGEPCYTPTHSKNLASNEGPFSRQEGEHDPCLNFSAQASRPHFYRSF
jgi:hypothetical protein